VLKFQTSKLSTVAFVNLVEYQPKKGKRVISVRTLFYLLVISCSFKNLFAQDIVPIYENDIYVCGQENPGDALDGICNASKTLQDVEGELTFYTTNTGRLDNGEVPEVLTTIPIKLISNSIGNQVYEMKDEAGVELDSRTLVGVLLKLSKEGYKDYYSQVVRLSAYGLDTKRCLIYNRTEFNRSGFVSDANRLIGRQSRNDISGAWMPERFEPRYMQIHQLVPMHIMMELAQPGKPSTTQKFDILYSPSK